MKELSLDDISAMSRNEAESSIRARVQTTYLGEQHVLTRILGRQKLYLSTKDVGFAGHVMMDGYWEIWLTQFFARTVKSGMTVVDVGANVGYYTLLFGDAVGATGKVLAVEPIPETAQLLARSVALNGHSAKTTIATCALGREAHALINMIVPEGEPKNAKVISAAVPGAVAVPGSTLDALTAEYSSVDLIKIDAEGAEEEIFAGMQGMLARCNPCVLLEFNLWRCVDAQKFLADLHQRFSSIRALDFNGELQRVTDSDLLDERQNEDWLLYLENPA